MLPARSSPRLNPSAASLLGFLHAGPMTGWELERAVMRTIGNFWNLTHSQVYRELHALRDAQLVRPGETGPRARRPYAITDAGREAFREWISREPAEEIIRFPLLLTVFFSEHVEPARLRRFLRAHRLRHEQSLEQFEKMADRFRDSTAGPALTFRFGLEYERAVMRWFASLPGLDDE